MKVSVCREPVVDQRTQVIGVLVQPALGLDEIEEQQPRKRE